MTRAVMLIAEGFQCEEAIYAYHRMIEEGWTVDVATPQTWSKFGQKKVWRKTLDGLPEHDLFIYGKFGIPMRVTIFCEDLRPDYDLVVIPGGFQSPDILRTVKCVTDFIKDMYFSEKLVAAICHAPWCLISAGIMSGVRCTGYKSIKDDLINAGAIYTGEPATVCGNIITGDHYKNNGHFMRAVVNYIGAEKMDKAIQQGYLNAP